MSNLRYPLCGEFMLISSVVAESVCGFHVAASPTHGIEFEQRGCHSLSFMIDASSVLNALLPWRNHKLKYMANLPSSPQILDSSFEDDFYEENSYDLCTWWFEFAAFIQGECYMGYTIE
ncbi:hypothetical protein PIB30_024588 [Stylosanthes scabra]|uniref:Uncharacterized protein n=1 Tax=Stylosanthes scabra TaxID=79078 RepID=A0ABU6U8P3_9FABA|nr:hypothetical protein [Stylosanthes scabra]